MSYPTEEQYIDSLFSPMCDYRALSHEANMISQNVVPRPQYNILNEGFGNSNFFGTVGDQSMNDVSGTVHGQVDVPMTNGTDREPVVFDDEDRTFQIQFNVWQKVPPPEIRVQAKKSKSKPNKPAAPLKPHVPRWVNYRPPRPAKKELRLSFYSTFGWHLFKRRLLEACNLVKPGISRPLMEAVADGEAFCEGWIHGAPRFKVKDHFLVHDNASLMEFLEAANNHTPETNMGFKFIHANPRTNAQASQILDGGDRDPSPDPSDDGSEMSTDSDALDPTERKYLILMTRFEAMFASGENIATAVNPANSAQVLLLNTSRIRTWAKDWADGVPGVDEVNPPMARPEFKYIRVLDYEREKAILLGYAINPAPSAVGSTPSVVHHNYYGNPDGNHPPAYTPNPTTRALSPPPGPVPFNDFLTFAGIGPDKQKARAALENEGIDDFFRFLDRETYSIANLRTMGIPFAQAEDIWKAVPRFIHHLKSL
ncbi:uncharacterized protein MELLADRAFT_93477 [Melampsora larici-populina 98AG31]|uniref:Uncharacterized protein n=1 Tax=Melampsora larici-populina (strain 98AG31 / pathotype 3-4-7) TaxID=747676 RepID=F4RAI9_MELLP|nr:uncharacterized protein MELLADRAFT_93477 [Melampsora larici-populina 98AG31]EGG10772.1 hypothetical protein MELLADRAFT_93477 [Melampsora larici-populina 98AG31]